MTETVLINFSFVQGRCPDHKNHIREKKNNKSTQNEIGREEEKTGKSNTSYELRLPKMSSLTASFSFPLKGRLRQAMKLYHSVKTDREGEKNQRKEKTSQVLEDDNRKKIKKGVATPQLSETWRHLVQSSLIKAQICVIRRQLPRSEA